MSWFPTKLFDVNCASGLYNLSILDQSVCFWSFDLEIIIPLLSKHQIILMFYNMMLVHSFFLWWSTDTHISSVVDHQIHCWIVIRQCPSYSITLWVLPLIQIPFGKLYHLLGQPCSAFELVVFTIEVCGIYFHDTLAGWTYAFLYMCELGSFHESYSSGISPGKTFNTNAFIKANSEWKVIHWRSGSRPWTLRSCPWTRCITYHGSCS